MDYNINKELTKILIDLIRIPTENPPGITKEIVDYLITEVFREEEGYQIKVIDYTKNNLTFHNLLVKVGSGKKKIVLTGHFDVVPAGSPLDWYFPPFSAEIKDNKLYGRGSVDMKGGLTMLIGVMKNLSQNPKFLKNYSVIFAGTADEEDGMTGAITLHKLGVMNNAELLVISEPTNMNIGIAEKGLLWVKLKVYGKAAHGSMPEKGINSILATAKIIPDLYNLLDRKSNSLLGSSTLNLGKIDGGTVINVVPEKTELKLDFRLIPEQDSDKLIEKIKNLDVSPCTLKIDILKRLPSLQTDVNHPIIQKLKEISKNELISLPYATDGVHLINPKEPIPFIIFGPGDPNIVHAINEYIELDSVFKSTELLTKAILQTYS